MRHILLFGIAFACQAQELPKVRVDVGFVRVACSVTDRHGRPVPDMRREDFVLLDNGKPRAIQHLWRETDLPLTIGLIADVSGSQLMYIEHHPRTLTEFLERVLRPQDQAFIATVARGVRLITDFTSSTQELQTGIDTIGKPEPSGTILGDCLKSLKVDTPASSLAGSCGTTVLWNSVYFASLLKMKPVDGRKALVILTDGIDSGSTRSLTDAIEAAQSADTLVYTIRYPLITGPLGILSPDTLGWLRLRRLSEETGGRAFTTPRANAAAIFGEIQEELRNLFILGFTVPESGRDGKVHRLEVKAKRGGVRVRARKRYVAA